MDANLTMDEMFKWANDMASQLAEPARREICNSYYSAIIDLFNSFKSPGDGIALLEAMAVVAAQFTANWSEERRDEAAHFVGLRMMQHQENLTGTEFSAGGRGRFQ